MESNGKAAVCGMGCRFPLSENIQEFWDNLQSGKDMVGSTKWPKGLHGLPPRSGNCKNIRENFDAKFFGINTQEDADESNVLLRPLLEVTYECIVDSGIRLDKLQKEKTGYYLAYSVCDSDAVETSKNVHRNKVNNGSSIIGSLVSHFGLTGPCKTIDTACSSSLSILTSACLDLEQNRCQYAIIAGSNIVDNPYYSLRFLRLGMLSPLGTSNVFDKSANGYVRSDGVAAILISRNEVDLPRIYATIVDVGVNCDGYKEEGIVFPSTSSQANLLKTLYRNISTNDIAYIEAHGTGTQAGDKSESNSLATVLCEGRSKPLLVGSVKSNMGHCEEAAGMAGMVKCLLSIHNGKIPGNLNYNTPNPDIPQLHNGQLSVVHKTIDLPDGLVGANSFGFGGVNGHVIFKPYKKKKCSKKHDVKMLLLTARNTATLSKLSEFICNNSNNRCLLNFISRSILSSEVRNPVRGYIKLSNEKVEYVDADQKKTALCLVINIPWTCTVPSTPTDDLEILKRLNTDHQLPDITTQNSPISKITTCIALVNALRECGVKPDIVVGSGLGEIVAAYVDGCLDLEQCLKITEVITDYVETCTQEYPFYELIIPVDIAYQLGSKVKVVYVYNENGVIVMVTAEGKEKIDVILKRIHTKGGVYTFLGKYPPLFTPLFQQQADELEKILSPIFKHPKLRSNSYLTASQQPAVNNNDVPRDVIDAGYFTRLLTKPCNLHRSVSSLAAETTLVDLCVDDQCCHVNHLGAKQPIRIHCQGSTFLDTLGILHIAGFDVDLGKINEPCTELPLDCKTSPIGHLVGWDHSHKCLAAEWYQFQCQVKDEPLEDYSFCVDHNSSIESLVIYHIWKAAMMKSKNKEEKSIKLSILGGNPHILYCGPTNIANVFILPGSKHFAISACDCKNGKCSHIISGFFDLCDDLELPTIPSYDVDLNHNVQKSDGSEDDVLKTDIKWDDNWLEYFDNIIDFSSITSKADIVRVYIDAKRHWKEVSECANIFTMYEPSSGICKSGGVALQFDVTSELLKERNNLMLLPDPKLPDSFIVELSICELNRGIMCLSYMGENTDKTTAVGMITIDGGKYCHQSVNLPEDLLHIEIFLPYVIAYHVVHDKLDLQEGQSVLFLPPLVGINLVMIWMAVKLNCQVFVATLEDNINSVKQLFPDIIQVPINTPGIIRKKTNGEGCDACVSLADPLSFTYLNFDSAIEWLSDHGKFVILGNPLHHGKSMGMGIFLRNITLSVCEPIQAILQLVKRNQNEMNIMTEGMLSDQFKKLSTMIYKEFNYPLTNRFEFQSPISLYLLVQMMEEPGAILDELIDDISPDDIEELKALQDIISFIPQEYSLAQDTFDSTCQSSIRGDRFNNALTVSGHTEDSPSPHQAQNKTLMLPSSLPRVRIISISGTPYNAPPVAQLNPNIVKSTPLSVEIRVTSEELEESGISVENMYRSNASKTSCPSRPPVKSKKRVHICEPLVLPEIHVHTEGCSSTHVSEKETVTPRSMMTSKSELAKPQRLSVAPIDVFLVGPPRTPRTPATTELMINRFEPSIIPLNNKKGRGLFIVHPIIGGVNILKPLAETLNLPCYGINRTVNTPETSIHCIASYYLNAMELHDPEGPYLLGGFSFGSMIALEIAHIIQSKGKKVEKFVVLDGSLEYVKAQIKPFETLFESDSEASFTYEDKLEVGSLMWFMNLYGPVKQKSFVLKALIGLHSLEERVEMAVDFLMGHVVVSPSVKKTKWLTAKHKVIQQSKKIHSGFYSTAQELVKMARENKARELVMATKLADKYNPDNYKIKGDVHLFRIKSDLANGQHLDADYGLSGWCTGKVNTTYCEGTHETFLAADKCHVISAYLNKLL